MEDKHPEIVVIKRHRSHEDEHHGGAWKIAFADFMTAMMAFFLVLWIINATDKDTKTVIARYFNPIKLEDPSRTRKGIKGSSKEISANEAKDIDGNAGEFEPAAVPEPANAASRKETGDAKKNSPENPPATLSERAVFDDPYESLQAIESSEDETEEPVVEPRDFKAAAASASIPEPFKPILQSEGPRMRPIKPAAVDAESVESRAGSASPPANSETAARPPASDDRKSTPRAPDIQEGVDQLRSDITKAAATLQHAQPGPAVNVQSTPEGILISLTDQADFSMFSVGSAQPQPKVIRLVGEIARLLKRRNGRIVLRGHTDARPFKSAVYDNWRLSTARAQMTYYMLIRSGLSENRVERVEGYADRALKNAKEPLSPQNRRIEILLQGAR